MVNKELGAIAIIVVSFMVVAMAFNVNGTGGEIWSDEKAITDTLPSTNAAGSGDILSPKADDPGPALNDTVIQGNETILTCTGGAGASVSPRFYLTTGITVIEIGYHSEGAEGNFEVALAATDGSSWQLLVDPAGHLGDTPPSVYNGEHLVGVSENGTSWTTPGWYEVQVTADGPWTITVERPQALVGDAVPCVLSGNTSKVSALEMPDGNVTFSLSYGDEGTPLRGTGYIGVWLYDNGGNFVDSLFVESGTFQGTRTMTFGVDCVPEMEFEDMCPPEPGTYWLEIVGDYGGDWTIEMMPG